MIEDHIGGQPPEPPQPHEEGTGETHQQYPIEDWLPELPYDSSEYLDLPETPYVPQREELHNRIIDWFIDTSKRAHHPPVALFLAGGPLTGKSTVLAQLADKLLPPDAVRVEPIQIRDMLPEYREIEAARDRYADFGVRNEVMDIARQVADQAMSRRLNVVIDGNGGGEPNQFRRHLERFHDAGYDVRVLLVDAPTDVALRRDLARASLTGRYLQEPALRKKHSEVSARFQDWKDLPWLTFRAYSNGDGP